MSSLLRRNRDRENSHPNEDFEAMISDEINTIGNNSTNSDNSNNNNNNNNRRNWLQRLGRGGKKDDGEENAEDDDDDDNSSQKLWGVSSNADTNDIDNFTFAPLPPNVKPPISSCDELVAQAPNFNDKTTTNELKISSNFSKLIANSKLVDQVRTAQRKAANASKQQHSKQQGGGEKVIITNSKQADEYMQKRQLSHGSNNTDATTSTSPNNSITTDGNKHKSEDPNNETHAVNNTNEMSTISVQKAQENLIENLKKGLDFLTSQNRQIAKHRDELEGQLDRDKLDFEKKLEMKEKELNERNLKLAVLEQHFMELNNPTVNYNGGGVGLDEEVDVEVEGEHSANNDNGDADNDATSPKSITSTTDADTAENSNTETNNQTSLSSPPERTTKKIVKKAVSSSIVQVDKGYFTDLEKTAKLQKIALEQFERKNTTMSQNITKYTAELEIKERTIVNLESNLKQVRESRFHKKSTSKKSHRRRVTESVITTAQLPQAAVNHSDDEFSVSNADASSAVEEKEKQAALTAKAVEEASEAQKAEHTIEMDVLSRQLDLKDKIIHRHEMKIYDLLNRKDNNTPAKMHHHNNRHVSPDVMVRNISVTNELMDTSIRKLEKMMEQLELIETEKRTDLADEISPIRRVATKVSLVHEEMKVAIKLIEQKVKNDVEKIKRSDEEEKEKENEGSHDDEEGKKSEQQSGEEGEEGEKTTKPMPSVDDRIAEVLSESMSAIKEMEASIKNEIDSLTEQLQRIEHELVGKQDTIEALEMACSEHVQNCRKMQEEMDQLKLGMIQV